MQLCCSRGFEVCNNANVVGHPVLQDDMVVCQVLLQDDMVVCQVSLHIRHCSLMRPLSNFRVQLDGEKLRAPSSGRPPWA